MNAGLFIKNDGAFEKQCTSNSNGDPFKTWVKEHDRAVFLIPVTINDINRLVITMNGKSSYFKLYELELE